MKHKSLIDIHVHSYYSDGDDSPEEIFRDALNKGIKTMVITDHNTLTHFDASKKAAQKSKIETLEGIEIDTVYKNVAPHLLGYSKHFNRNLLKKGLQVLVDGYNQHSQKVIKHLQKKGLAKFDFETIKRLTKGSYVHKYHIAKGLMMFENYSMYDARRLLRVGGDGYVPPENFFLPPDEIVKLIINSGGVAVLAHPSLFFYRNESFGEEESWETILELIPKLTKNGLSGIELHHPRNNPRYLETINRLAQQYKLLITGGSDYHGIHHDSVYSHHWKLGSGGISDEEWQKLKEIIRAADF